MCENIVSQREMAKLVETLGWSSEDVDRYIDRTSAK